MIRQVLKVFPDDKPITAICIVEDSSKCPTGFYVVRWSQLIFKLSLLLLRS